jgi:hypothetical protein
VTWTTKATIFRVFAAGEALEDCAGVAADLGASGVGLIVDHSKEEAEDEWEHNLEEKVELLSSLRASLGERVVFVPVKVTALADPSMLEAVTAALASHAAGLESGEGGHGGGGCTEGQIQLARSGYAEGVLERELDGVNRALLERAEDSLGVLLEAAQREDLPLLLDAEQRWEVACRETETVNQRQLAPPCSISHASLPLLLARGKRGEFRNLELYETNLNGNPPTPHTLVPYPLQPSAACDRLFVYASDATV